MLLVGALVTSSSCNNSRRANPPITLSGPTMGTQYTVKLAKLPDGISAEFLSGEINDRLRLINQQMSTYIEDSEISRFNRAAADSWFDVSPETALVVQAAQSISESTGGAFDVTVGPLVDLWNFGPDRREQTLPSDAEVDKARQRVGFAKLSVRKAPPALKKDAEGLRVDLSAIAKGYAVDAVAEILDECGVTSYMVEIGGEIRVKGSRPGAGGWRIGIESPVSGKRRIERVIELKDIAMATSGDYRNYFEVDGKRYSHTIDSATGRPVKHALASVTVLAKDCMTADALATALLVMGPERGLAWAEENRVAARFVTRTKEGFHEQTSKSFAELHPPS